MERGRLLEEFQRQTTGMLAVRAAISYGDERLVRMEINK